MVSDVLGWLARVAFQAVVGVAGYYVARVCVPILTFNRWRVAAPVSDAMPSRRDRAAPTPDCAPRNAQSVRTLSAEIGGQLGAIALIATVIAAILLVRWLAPSAP